VVEDGARQLDKALAPQSVGAFEDDILLAQYLADVPAAAEFHNPIVAPRRTRKGRYPLPYRP
jgi:hypothetical protein